MDDSSVASLSTLGQDASTVALLGAKRPQAKKAWTNRYVKLLVIGDSGLGKTTLVKCLLATPGEGLALHDGSSTTFEEFRKNPAKYCSVVEWDDDEDHVHWTYQIQDTPGYGDELDLHNNIRRIKELIADQNDLWHQRETDTNRGQLDKVIDPRIDICIFCLPPHRVRNIDIHFMHQVSQMVPVLPVVTKADTMTARERINFRADLNQRLLHPHRDSDEAINLFQFSEDTLAACGITDSNMVHTASMPPPYLVVCSNVVNQDRLTGDEPQFWPERNYDWGTCEAFNTGHSDLLLLRRLLLQEGVAEIAKGKVERYESWRSNAMCQIKPLRKLASMLLTTAFVMGTFITIAVASGRLEFKKVKKIAADTGAGVKDAAKDVAVATKDIATDVAVATKDTVGETAVQVGNKIQTKSEEARKATVSKIDDVREKSDVLPTPESRKKFFGIF